MFLHRTLLVAVAMHSLLHEGRESSLTVDVSRQTGRSWLRRTVVRLSVPIPGTSTPDEYKDNSDDYR